MAINLEDKKAIVAEVNEAAKVALSAVVADARGVTVGAMTGLRKEAREAGVYVRVVRNTLLKRAVAGTQYDVLNDVFTGPTLIAFSKEHPGAAARIFKEFAKGQDKFEIKAAALTSATMAFLSSSLIATGLTPACYRFIRSKPNVVLVSDSVRNREHHLRRLVV